MPIYEYQCQACGHEFETLQKMSEPELTDCPKCETASLVKKISAVAFRLKGSGWYETDFKSGQKRQLHEDASNGDSKGSDSASDKSESKSSNASDSSTSTSSSESATSA